MPASIRAGSALFLPELLKYANVKRGIDANVTAVLSATATLKVFPPQDSSFNVSQKHKISQIV